MNQVFKIKKFTSSDLSEHILDVSDASSPLSAPHAPLTRRI